MESFPIIPFILGGGLFAFIIWKKWSSKQMKPWIDEYLNSNALVVDVRTPDEFRGGHVEGSVNIPLNVLEARMHELDKARKLIVCCASGGRSSSALNILKNNGFDQVINAGPWVNAVRSNQVLAANKSL